MNTVADRTSLKMWFRWMLLCLIVLASLSSTVQAGNDDYYAAGDDANNYNDNNDDGNYNNNAVYNDDVNYYAGDDGNGDDYYNAGDDGDDNAGDDNAGDDNAGDDNADDNAGDDDGAANGDDGAANAVDDGDDGNQYYYQDDWGEREEDYDDDNFHWSDTNVGFDGVSVMPVSCINYNNGHMIKFEFFESDGYQCHTKKIGTFVVSIAHYMRAFFNYQALVYGQDFALPDDVGFINCIMLEQTSSRGEPLYGKIGCRERETFTSTKLALHVYTDKQCSEPYDDGLTSREHSSRGYQIKGQTYSTFVDFRPTFYNCQKCSPEEISDTFNKQAGTWYDDDYINKQDANQDEEKEEENEQQDDYYHDDAYLAANDDFNNDDDYNNRQLASSESNNLPVVRSPPRQLSASEDDLKRYEQEFWNEHRRELYDNMYGINGWNMCQRLYKYGMLCDEACESLDIYRRDRWSSADVLLLSIMCTFFTAMMILIVAKRLKAAQKTRMVLLESGQEYVSMPGLPPVAMLAIFVLVMLVIVVMAKLKFVNQTLVLAVMVCLLLFIYMLKLTLFDNRRPVLLAAARHDIYDTPTLD